MGRYSRPLAVPFADFAGLPLDGRVLDVGCGPGALTAELARRAGPGRVTAVDPSEEFVAALRGRHPGVEVIRAPAEDLPFEGGCFRSEEHTSELQSRVDLVCRLLLEKKKTVNYDNKI